MNQFSQESNLESTKRLYINTLGQLIEPNSGKTIKGLYVPELTNDFDNKEDRDLDPFNDFSSIK